MATTFFSNRTAQALLNSLFGKTSNFGALATAPAMWLGLSSTTPGEDGTNVTEPSTGAYTRVLVNAAGWNNASNANPSVIDNAGVITFPTATGDWLSGANLTHIVVFDHETNATANNVVGKIPLNVPKPVLSGDTFTVGAGDADITLI